MSDYSDYFSADTLLGKINHLSSSGYCELIRKVLILYVLFISAEVPAVTKVLIVAALGYFICPIDAIPDLIPMIGYSDDVSVIGLLLTQLDDLISPSIEAEVESLMPSSCC